jgi:hypothetical protein
MIYDNIRTTLYNITNDMKDNKFNIYGIKTDAIYFDVFEGLLLFFNSGVLGHRRAIYKKQVQFLDKIFKLYKKYLYIMLKMIFYLKIHNLIKQIKNIQLNNVKKLNNYHNKYFN